LRYRDPSGGPSIRQLGTVVQAKASDGAGLSSKPHIAIAIGDARQRSQMSRCLMSFYLFAEYASIARAIAGCRADVPVLALVSEKLPGGSGFDFVRMLRLDPVLAAIPVVMVVTKDDKPTRDGVAQCGAETHLIASCPRSAPITAISGLLNRAVERRWRTLPALQRKVLTGTLELFNGISDVISSGGPICYRAVGDACRPLVQAVANDDFRSILDGVKSHDNYSYAHSMRVATYLALFGCNLHLPLDEQVLLASGGLLHDVGKMSIPHEVLNKSGILSEAEFAVMKGHVTASVAYLSKCPNLPKGILTIAGQHHEKLDGTGYPLGLAGNKLNRLVRIASIIDVFSALTDRRVYKPPMDAEAALNLMVNEMGSHLDIKLLGLFRQMLLDAAREISRPG
jgi:HD-GYP domain-containing protein (c-di-GMP phosphodiesterase class II)